MKNIKLLVLIGFIATLLLNQAIAQESLKITTPEGIYVSVVSKKILKEAYKRMDIDVTFVEQSGERAIINAESGEADGVLNRISGIETQYNNLVMLPTPINSMIISVFTKNVSFSVNGWESLLPYTTVIRRGIKAIETQIPNELNYHSVTNYKQVFLMIEHERVDLGLYPLNAGMLIIKNLGLKDIKPLTPPLCTSDLYHYLHKRHSVLLPKLTKILSDMESNGDIKRIKEQTHKELVILE